MGMKVIPANTGMKCRDHSGEPRLEKRCEGPCNKVKPLSAFSKNNLTNGMTVSITPSRDADIWGFSSNPRVKPPTVVPILHPLAVESR